MALKPQYVELVIKLLYLSLDLSIYFSSIDQISQSHIGSQRSIFKASFKPNLVEIVKSCSAEILSPPSGRKSNYANTADTAYR